jgi:serine/threonine protein kinase
MTDHRDRLPPEPEIAELDPALAQRPEGWDPTSLVGQVIDGRYKILKPLAFGGMGSVFLAEQVTLNRKVALKVMSTADDELLERFRREAVALCEVSHPAIVEIHDFTTWDGAGGVRGCLIMAFIDGEDLADYLAKQPERRLPPDEVVYLMLPIASALVELHANGVIHRDIKPDNLVRFMRADGRPGLKLVDFGIARRQLDRGMTASGFVMGTPPYLAPEALLGERQTPLSDIYALGSTVFELLTGAPPFGRGNAGTILQRTLNENPVFPTALRGSPLAGLLRRMLATRDKDRPDALQVLHGLESVRATSSAQLPAVQEKDGTENVTRRIAAIRRHDPVSETPEAAPAPPSPGSRATQPVPTRAEAVPAPLLVMIGVMLGAAVTALVTLLR